MKKIMIGFSRPRKFNLFSLLIRIWQGWTPYCHVLIYFELPEYNRSMVFEASHFFVHFMPYQRWAQDNMLIDRKWIDLSDEEFKNFVRWSLDQANKPYSIKDILGIVLGKLNFFKDGEKAFICSELAARALKIDQASDFITPKQLHQIIFRKE